MNFNLSYRDNLCCPRLLTVCFTTPPSFSNFASPPLPPSPTLLYHLSSFSFSNILGNTCRDRDSDLIQISFQGNQGISNPTNISASEEEISINQSLIDSTDDKHVMSAGHKPQDSNTHKSCADIINSVRRRFTKKSNGSFSYNNETTVMDLASSFSRLPFQILTPMLCPAIYMMSPGNTPGSPPSEISNENFGFRTFLLSKSGDSIIRPSLTNVHGEAGETKDASVLAPPLLHRNFQCPTPTLMIPAPHDIERGDLSTNDDSGREELYELTTRECLMYKKVHNQNPALERGSSGTKEHGKESHTLIVNSQSESDVIGDTSPIPSQGLQRLYAFRRPRRV